MKDDRDSALDSRLDADDRDSAIDSRLDASLTKHLGDHDESEDTELQAAGMCDAPNLLRMFAALAARVAHLEETMSSEWDANHLDLDKLATGVASAVMPKISIQVEQLKKEQDKNLMSLLKSEFEVYQGSLKQQSSQIASSVTQDVLRRLDTAKASMEMASDVAWAKQLRDYENIIEKQVGDYRNLLESIKEMLPDTPSTRPGDNLQALKFTGNKEKCTAKIRKHSCDTSRDAPQSGVFMHSPVRNHLGTPRMETRQSPRQAIPVPVQALKNQGDSFRFQQVQGPMDGSMPINAKRSLQQH